MAMLVSRSRVAFHTTEFKIAWKPTLMQKSLKRGLFVNPWSKVKAEIFLQKRRIGGRKNAKPPVIRRKITAVTGVSLKNNSDYSRFLGNFRR